MPRKVTIFAGAPEAHSLDWTVPNLLNHFLPPIASFARLDASSTSPDEALADVSLLSTPDPAVWRSIPLHRELLRTGFSQTHELAHPYEGAPDFFMTLSGSFDTASGLSQDKLSQSVIDQFYEHSLAIHRDVHSSQSISLSLTTDNSSFDVTDDIGQETSVQEASPAAVEAHSLPGNNVGHLSDLEDVPDAKHLLAIAPQTMTVNLIVGIISIAEPRTVKTRWGTTSSLIELLVGDETKSGFSVTFWMSSEPSKTSTLVRGLRRQDVVLLRNVALSVFMKKVHGYSLRKGHTKVDLLHRRRIDKDDEGGMYTMKDISSTKRAHPQLAKARKVREWLLHFIGDGGISLGKRRHDGRPVNRWDLPPDDTQ
ncbi:hypothetical protein F4861DRAFT_43591 [Xylaria intraflava]|nr:hypothetical protein F4861DRAFT_43591 [Xylaria intraflava]